ncbi:MAG: hypothetical protein HZB12_02310 [Candidatus Yonathbacteria bacterium]|nr:hypothetical protein [Candidatus Yonathbacteria bacterium]
MQNTNYTTVNKKIGAMALSFALLVLPTIAYGAGLIPCGDPAGDPVAAAAVPPTNHPCGFNDVIVLANNIISFLMFKVSIPLAALGFMYAGARLVLFQKKEGEWTAAKERFGDMAMGFGYILGAYVLIKTVLYAFLTTEQVNFMKFIFDVTQ